MQLVLSRLAPYRLRVAVFCVILAVAGFAGGFIFAPSATAESTFYVSAAGAARGVDNSYDGTLLAQRRVTSYVELAHSTKISKEVAAGIGAGATPKAVAASIDASSRPDSVLIDVSVTANTMPEAARKAELFNESFIRLIDELEQPPVPAAVQAVQIRLVQPPVVRAPSGFPNPFNAIFYGVLGAVLAVLTSVAWIYGKSASMVSSAKLEEITGKSNIAVIPRSLSVQRGREVVEPGDSDSFAEAYKVLRSALVLSHDAPKVILVTSAVPGEGKSTTAANLGAVLAMAGNKVLLIDGDLRKPRLAKMFGLVGTTGLSTVLSGRTEVDVAIQRSRKYNLDVLAAGRTPPNPSELLASPQMDSLIKSLRKQYSMIVIDSPPLLLVTDAIVAARSVDCAILSVSTTQGKRTNIQAALGQLTAAKLSPIYTILTLVKGGPARATPVREDLVVDRDEDRTTMIAALRSSRVEDYAAKSQPFQRSKR